MTISEKLAVELKAAMLARDAERLSALRMLKSAISYAQIERKDENLPESELIAIVQREIKKRRDSLDQFEKGGRPELAAKEKQELHVLEIFLPKPFTAEELEALVKYVIQETGATGKKDMGLVIKAVQAKAAGRADGKSISTLTSSLLP